MKNRFVHRALFFALSLFFLPGFTFSQAPSNSTTIQLETLNWAPYFDENLPRQGYVAAICSEAFSRAGYHLEIDFIPWNRALTRAVNGQSDGLFGAYYTKEREKTMIYSDAIGVAREIYIVNRDDKRSFSGLEEMAGIILGIYLGHAFISVFEDAGLTIDTSRNDRQSLYKLIRQRVDVVVIDESVFKALVKGNPDFHNQFRILDFIFREEPFFITVSRKRENAQTVVTRFNDALFEMKTNGDYQSILDEFGMASTQ